MLVNNTEYIRFNKRKSASRRTIKIVYKDFQAIVTIGAREIGSYIVVYAKFVKATKFSNTFIRSPRSLRLDRLNKFSSFSFFL